MSSIAKPCKYRQLDHRSGPCLSSDNSQQPYRASAGPYVQAILAAFASIETGALSRHEPVREYGEAVPSGSNLDGAQAPENGAQTPDTGSHERFS